MTRTQRTILVIVFVLAAALLPQALFAQSYTVCADESNPQSCVERHAEQHAAARQYGPAARRTVCGDDGNPQSCVVQAARPYAARAQRSNVYGAGDVDRSATAGVEGFAQAQPAPARHASSGGYGPHYSEQ